MNARPAIAALVLAACGAAPEPAAVPEDDPEAHAAPPAPPPEPPTACSKACTKLRDVMMAELEAEVEAMPAEVRKGVLARAEQTRTSDIEHCSQLCARGRLDTACVERSSSKIELSHCVKERERLPPDRALSETLLRCRTFTALAKHEESDCESLADEVQAVAETFRDVDQKVAMAAAEKTELEGCMDRIAETGQQRCQGHAPYARAMSLVVLAAMR